MEEIITDFLHYFGNNSDFNKEREAAGDEPWVSATLISGERDTPTAVYRVDYSKPEEKK